MNPSSANGGGSKVAGWWVDPVLVVVVAAGLGNLAVASEPPSRTLSGLEPPALVDAVAMPLGPGQNSWLVMGSEFVGTRSNFIPLRTGFAAELACTIGSGTRTARAKLPLPDGATLQAIDVWRYQVPPAVLGVQLRRHCLASDSADSSEPVSLLSTVVFPSGAAYSAFSIALPPLSIDALQCSYYLEVSFGEGCPYGLDLRLLGIRVAWLSP